MRRRTRGSAIVGAFALVAASAALTPAVAGPAPMCTLTCPGNITVGNDADECSAIVTPDAPPVAEGTCGTPECSPAFGSTFAVGTTTVTCTASPDGVCDFTVTVNDTQPPSITCSDDITVGNDPDQCDAVVSFDPPAVSDNCPDVGSPNCSPPAGSTFPVGTTTVTCDVSDDHSNSASCAFTASVNDVQFPVIDIPPNQQRLTSGGRPVRVIYPSTLGAFDNCPPTFSESTCVPPTGSDFAAGVTTVTCTATDAAGNTTTDTFLVTISHAAPVLGAGMLVILCAGLGAVAVRKLRAR